MTEPERWIRIDAAAAGLGLSVRQTERVARADGWKKTGGRPAFFALSDIRATHARRKREREQQDESEGTGEPRPRASDRRLPVSA